MNITKNIILDTAIKLLLVVAMIFCSGFAMVQYGRFASRKPVIQSDKEGVIVLKAADAEILGPGSARLEQYAGQQDIGYWDSTAQSLKYRLKVDRTNVYEIRLTYSLPAGQKTEFRISVGDRQIDSLIEGQGGWDHWRETVVGKVEISAGQTHDLLVIPLNTFGKEGVMNFCQLTITPISE